jgi:hypothetical protein
VSPALSVGRWRYVYWLSIFVQHWGVQAGDALRGRCGPLPEVGTVSGRPTLLQRQLAALLDVLLLVLRGFGALTLLVCFLGIVVS